MNNKNDYTHSIRLRDIIQQGKILEAGGDAVIHLKNMVDFDVKTEGAYYRGTFELIQDIVDASNELLELKRIKDRDGKTPDYEARQPVAWKRLAELMDYWNSSFEYQLIARKNDEYES